MCACVCVCVCACVHICLCGHVLLWLLVDRLKCSQCKPTRYSHGTHHEVLTFCHVTSEQLLCLRVKDAKTPEVESQRHTPWILFGTNSISCPREVPRLSVLLQLIPTLTFTHSLTLSHSHSLTHTHAHTHTHTHTHT